MRTLSACDELDQSLRERLLAARMYGEHDALAAALEVQVTVALVQQQRALELVATRAQADRDPMRAVGRHRGGPPPRRRSPAVQARRHRRA